MIEFGHLSHPGTLNRCNESTYAGNGQLGFWILLDGIGGEGCGEVAASTARDTIQKSLRISQSVTESILAAGQAVSAIPKVKSHLRGTSAVVLRYHDATDGLELGWIGATRAFGINGQGEWSELTVPDASTPASIRTMALGVTELSRLHVARCDLPTREYTRILLCSDAVVPAIGELRVAEILRDREISAQEMVDTLTFEALEQEIEDSFSIIALKL